MRGVSEMNKKLLIFKRKKAKELHEKGWSNRKIVRHLLASKNSVGKWVQMDESEISSDNRGWEKGKSRKYTPETKQQIISKYIRPEKRGIATRIEGQTTEETITALKEIWKTHPLPEILKIDNDSAFGANLPHERYIGKLAFFLLNLGVYPLYIAPRSPWNNGQVEGFNSVFSKKFWKISVPNISRRTKSIFCGL